MNPQLPVAGRLAVAAAVALLVLAGSPRAAPLSTAESAARGGAQRLSIGVVEQAVVQPTLAASKTKLRLVRAVGFDTVEVAETWTLGQSTPPAQDVTSLRNAYATARALGMHVVLAVFPYGSSQTPLTAEADEQFASFTTALARELGSREVVVGNEPNLNRFWLPQFGVGGSDAAAPAYLELLQQTRNALKSLDPSIVVDGGALAAHGSDDPLAPRPTHSPTRFIADLGAAYRALGARRPLIDAFDLHPYELGSAVPPTTTHPTGTTIAIADYGKLVAALDGAFAGTAQPSASLPIVYGEFGVESQIPAAKAHLYVGTEPATTRPVDELTQGRYYREAIALASCQPRVRSLLLFHAFDEQSRAGWQSGVYYADGTPKRSLPIVRAAIRAARRGTIALCDRQRAAGQEP